jgi:hypothetical protein
LIIRVCRDELYSHSQSPSPLPDPALGEAFLKILGDKFSNRLALIPPLVVDQDGKSEDEEVEFRLFAASSAKDEKAITKIRMQSPSLDDTPAGLVNPNRPREYYFRDSLSQETEGCLRVVAVSGEDVLARSCTSWPGCALPWRVTTIVASGKRIQTTSELTVNRIDVARKKTRKSRRTRIAIRKKAMEERERKEKEQDDAAEKELAERAKRAKRNRDKKLKKRERDKAKKAAARASGEEVAESSDDASE